MWHALKTHSNAPPVGLEFTRSTVRLLQLEGEPEPRWVKACAEWLGLQDDAAKVPWHELDVALRLGGFEGRRGVLALPAEDVHVRTLQCSADSADDPKSLAAIMTQADDNEGYVWPLTPMQPVSTGASPVLTFLHVAAPAIERWRDRLRVIGIELNDFQPRQLAVFHMLQTFLRRRSDHHRTQTLIDVGEEASSVMVSAGAEPYFLKTVPIGERRLSETTAAGLGVGIAEVRQLRHRVRRLGLAGAASSGQGGMLTPQSDQLAWTLFDAAREIIDELVFEIGLCIKHCQSTYGAPRIENVWLAGDAAEETCLHHLLAQRLGVCVNILEPFRGIEISRSSLGADRRGALAEWAACVGVLRSQYQTRVPLCPIGFDAEELRP
jgi:hypothetical protein